MTPDFDPADALLPGGWLDAFRFEWISALRASINYLPIVLPFALATVVGGIDCTESAAAAGDEYDTGRVIATEGFATLVAGLGTLGLPLAATAEPVELDGLIEPFLVVKVGSAVPGILESVKVFEQHS